MFMINFEFHINAHPYGEGVLNGAWHKNSNLIVFDI